MAELKPGPRATEFWGTQAASVALLFGDQAIPIPENVREDPVLMVIIIVAKIAGVVLLQANYAYGRSRVKEAASQPAPLILGDRSGPVDDK